MEANYSPASSLPDIQLADGSSGLEAVNQILGSFEIPVIFITAYPERFLTGAPPELAFLITKPFSVDSLKAVISQFCSSIAARIATGYLSDRQTIGALP